MKGLIRAAFRKTGFDLVRFRSTPTSIAFPADISSDDREILARINDYTMTSVDRQIALIHATRYLVRHGIQGCIVECGVWRGGSSMAAALTLIQEGDTERELYLYDTFDGMPPPQEVDRTVDGTLAQTYLDRSPDRTGYVWAVAGIDDVRQNMASTGYPSQRLTYVRGPVEQTIPMQSPRSRIALLRLDTDWYESTKHELEHLFPLLCEGGVLIVDDYGHWQGSRKAVDEYFGALGRPYYLHRVDVGRVLVKTSVCD